jgi:hypothetical protein
MALDTLIPNLYAYVLSGSSPNRRTYRASRAVIDDHDLESLMHTAIYSDVRRSLLVRHKVNLVRGAVTACGVYT